MATPAVGGTKISATNTGGSSVPAKTGDVLGKVAEALTGQLSKLLKGSDKVPWSTPLPGILGEARKVIQAEKGAKGAVTPEALVKKATDMIGIKLQGVNQKTGQGALHVSNEEVMKLAKQDPEAGKLVAGAYTAVSGRKVDLSGLTAGGKAEAAAKGDAVDGKKTAVETDKNAAANQSKVADRQSKNGLGFGVEDGPRLTAAVDKAFKAMGKSASGAEMMALLQAAHHAGIPAEAVADQLISGEGPFAKLLAINPTESQTGLTMDSISALVTQLRNNGVPTDPEQRKAYGARVDGLIELISTNGIQGVDLEGPQNGPRITPEIYAQAQQYAGRGGVLSREEHELIPPGPFRRAADELRAVGGAAARITMQGLAMRAAQMFTGAPMFDNGFMQFSNWGAGVNPGSFPLNPGYYAATNNTTTAMRATMGMGFMPTGNNMYDLASSIAHSPTYSPTEQALLNTIKDPQQRAIQELQMQMQKQALMCTVLTNLANMRHEMLKSVANNLRG